MSPELMDRYVKAGKTIRQIRRSASEIVYEGKSYLDICEDIEEATREKGCEPAFPCNIGVNEVAAHYTASPHDDKVIPADSVVKVDLGAHLDGCIADTAVTVILNPEYELMLIAADEALDRALKAVSPGTKIRKVSRIVQRTIEGYGYKPISNLCGHRTTPYVVHASPSIPNLASPFTHGKLEPDNVYAIEPFVTTKDAAAKVIDGPPGNIHHIAKLRKPKSRTARNLFHRIYAKYRTLPFTLRWLLKEGIFSDIRMSFETLRKEARIESYPTYYEQTSKPVVQAEHSILLTRKEVVVLT